jgi:3-phenylpropionate/trans-cinnamate dioxygenase ferredoxin subunit
MAKYVVCAVEELPPNQRRIVEIAGRSVGVFNVNGEYYALRNSCPHQGGPLCAGRVSGFLTAAVPGEYAYTRRGEILRCPWHGWEFDITTGQSWFDPQRTRVRTYPVSVEAMEGTPANEAKGALQPGPYVAETYPVSVEQRMVVVEIT